MQPNKHSLRPLPAVLLVISLLAVYLASMARGPTWAHYGADGSDLITAAATGGVAHPTGYPLYLLLARLFQWLPLGSLAFRTNLMSAVDTICAALLVYRLVACALLPANPDKYWLAGLAGAYAFGLAPLVWSQAVITEVYALHGLFILLILCLAAGCRYTSLTPGKLDALLGLTFGLSMGNHVTTIFLLPVVFLAGVPRNDGLTRPPGISVLRRLAWSGAGLLVYLVLPLRAISAPPVNWGNPVNLERLAWLVSARLYQDQFLALSVSSFWERIQTEAALLLQQFGIPGLVLGLSGFIIFFTRSPLYRSTLWTAVVFSLFAIAYGTGDSSVYLIPACACFAIWIGIGLGKLMEAFTRRLPAAGWLLGLGLILYIGIQAGSHWHLVDASRDLRAERFGDQILAQAPEHAIIFARGDQAVFTLWYYHFALHKRPDLAIIAADMLPFDWYQETLRSAYPALALPASLPFPEAVRAANPERPVCHVQAHPWTLITCSPAQQP